MAASTFSLWHIRCDLIQAALIVESDGVMDPEINDEIIRLLKHVARVGCVVGSTTGGMSVFRLVVDILRVASALRRLRAAPVDVLRLLVWPHALWARLDTEMTPGEWVELGRGRNMHTWD